MARLSSEVVVKPTLKLLHVALVVLVGPGWRGGALALDERGNIRCRNQKLYA